MALERFKFRVTGTTPILMNSPLGMKKPGGDTMAKVKKVPSPEDEARSLLYRNDDGTVYGPAGFKSAITTAAKGMKFGKLGGPGIIKGSVFTPIDGDKVPLYDPKTKKPSTRNPFWKPKHGDFNIPGVGVVPIGINELQDSGVLFCACNMAVTVYSAAIADAMKLDAEEVKKDWLSGILPGVEVMPAGIWAINRAQEKGCSYCFTG